MEPVLFFLVFAVVAGIVGYISWLQAKKRRELFRQFALSQNWTWAARDDGLVGRFDGKPFDEGDTKRAANVLQGQFRGRPMVAFDYSYETHTADSRGNSNTTTHRYAFCSLALPDAVPTLEVLPESMLGRLGTALGMQDIELESEDFNRRYRVRCSNPKFASDVLPPRTMQALLSRTALHLRLERADALCWEQGRHTPSELLARLDALATMIDGIPAFVWNDLKGSTT